MRRRNLLLAGAAAFTLLSGCGGSEEGVGGVTAEEAAQLNNAAEMLDASPDGLAAPDNVLLDGQGGIPSDASSNPEGEVRPTS